MQRIAPTGTIQQCHVRASRRGVAMVEGAIVLGVFLTIVLGTLDLGLALLRKNVVTEGARRVAREAIVHGSLAPPEDTAWGPTTYAGWAGDTTEIAAAIQPVLVTIEPHKTSIQVDWPDGGNRPGQRVRVTVGYQHDSLFPFLNGDHFYLSSECVMRIAH